MTASKAINRDPLQNRCHTDRLSFFLYYGSGGSSSTIFATASDGPRGGIALASDKLKQEGRGADCKAGLDVKPVVVVVVVVMAVVVVVVPLDHRTHTYSLLPGTMFCSGS